MQDLIKYLVEKNEELVGENANLKENIWLLERQVNRLSDINAHLINELNDLKNKQ